MNEKNIFLWGFMGSGKTSLGQRLSVELNTQFVDLDKYISESEGQSISNIFELKGELYFREIERKYLMKLLQNKTNKMVVACGGGTPCYNGLNQFMLNDGLCIYIKCDVNTLVGRLKNERHYRPLISELSQYEMYSWIEDLMIERGEIYHSANYVIENNGLEESALNQMKKGLLNY